MKAKASLYPPISGQNAITTTSVNPIIKPPITAPVTDPIPPTPAAAKA